MWDPAFQEMEPHSDPNVSAESQEGSASEEDEGESETNVTLEEIETENKQLIQHSLEKLNEPSLGPDAKLALLFDIHMASLIQGFCVKNPETAQKLYTRKARTGSLNFRTKEVFQHLPFLVTKEPVSWRDLVSSDSSQEVSREAEEGEEQEEEEEQVPQETN
jgi:hypothetical protein